MCTVLLPPGVNQIAINKYIYIKIGCFETSEIGYPLTRFQIEKVTETSDTVLPKPTILKYASFVSLSGQCESTRRRESKKCKLQFRGICVFRHKEESNSRGKGSKLESS